MSIKELTIDGEVFRSCDGCRIYFDAMYVGASCPCCTAKEEAHRNEVARQDLSDRLHTSEGVIHKLGGF